MDGLGVLLRGLSGYGDTAEILKDSIGKKIESVKFNSENDSLDFLFQDGSTMVLSDHGQSCCEQRYMKCEDDLSHYTEATLQNVEIRDMTSERDIEYGEYHDEQALVVTTSKGSFTAVTHNEHNGYYGGFSIEATR